MSMTTPPADTALGLYVPVDATRLGIAEGSAVVGRETEDGMVLAYYEGSVHGQRMDFEEKVQHAAGRMAHRYPTASMGLYPEAELTRAGSVERSDRLGGWIVADVSEPALLEKWAGAAVAVGGSDAMRQRAAGIAWGRLSPAARMQLQMRARDGRSMTDLVLGSV